MMTATEWIAVPLWLFIVGALFIRSSPRRAVLAGLIGGWLFLPNVSVSIPGLLPDLTKSSITSLGLLGAVLFLDRTRLLSLRPRWFDLPMLVWCLSPFPTALVNGESAYEGISAVMQNTIVWGIPYLMGRLYIQDADSWRELAVAVFLGGLAYVPLCWFEIFAGPQLAQLVYGYTPKAVETAFRFGGWRPVVFMAHGLMVALWMASASVSGFWLWRTGVLPRVGRVPTGALVPILCITTVALKSVNAWLLLVFGILILWLVTGWRTAWPVWASLALILLYIGARASGVWTGQELTALTANVLDAKTLSLGFRLENEQQLAERARLHPLLGWGRWARSSVTDAMGNVISTADSLWIIAFGQQGTVGLAALFAFLLLPVIFLLRYVPVASWYHSEFAPAAALAVILLLYTIDNLANAMPNPTYLLAAGGLLTLPSLVSSHGGVAANAATERKTLFANTSLATQSHGTGLVEPSQAAIAARQSEG
jgi:hypothetical protein